METNKFLGIVCFILLLSLQSVVSLTGNEQAYETEFAAEGIFSSYFTIADEENEGVFHINEPIPVIYAFINDKPSGNLTITIGLEDTEDTVYLCTVLDLPNTNPDLPYYGFCDLNINMTGHYAVEIVADGVDYYVGSIEVIPPNLGGLFWLFLALIVICIILGIFVAKIFILFAILLTIAEYTYLIFAFSYAISGTLLLGLVGLVYVGLIYLIFWIMNYYILEDK